MVPILKTELMFLVKIDNDFFGLTCNWLGVRMNTDDVRFGIGISGSDFC
jgi:hypothetical protein